jgi:hypothetical protein
LINNSNNTTNILLDLNNLSLLLSELTYTLGDFLSENESAQNALLSDIADLKLKIALLESSLSEIGGGELYNDPIGLAANGVYLKNGSNPIIEFRTNNIFVIYTANYSDQNNPYFQATGFYNVTESPIDGRYNLELIPVYIANTSSVKVAVNNIKVTFSIEWSPDVLYEGSSGQYLKSILNVYDIVSLQDPFSFSGSIVNFKYVSTSLENIMVLVEKDL